MEEAEQGGARIGVLGRKRILAEAQAATEGGEPAPGPEPAPAPEPAGPTAQEQRQMDSMGVTLEQLRQLHGSDAYDAHEDGDEKLLAAEAEDHFDVDAAPGGRGRTVRDSRINRASALALSMLCSTLLSASGLRASGHGKPPTGRRGVKASEQ